MSNTSSSTDPDDNDGVGDGVPRQETAVDDPEHIEHLAHPANVEAGSTTTQRHQDRPWPRHVLQQGHPQATARAVDSPNPSGAARRGEPRPMGGSRPRTGRGASLRPVGWDPGSNVFQNHRLRTTFTPVHFNAPEQLLQITATGHCKSKWEEPLSCFCVCRVLSFILYPGCSSPAA